MEITLWSSVSTLKDKMGMGKPGHCIVGFSFERNHYYPGENINVKMDCDNRMCTRSIRNFKFKLIRKLVAVSPEIEKKQRAVVWSKSEIAH